LFITYFVISKKIDNGILLQKLFSDRTKILKFEAEGQEFARSEQFLVTDFFWSTTFIEPEKKSEFAEPLFFNLKKGGFIV
jgi:hypothetical protein